jgi:hypothetical protein
MRLIVSDSGHVYEGAITVGKIKTNSDGMHLAYISEDAGYTFIGSYREQDDAHYAIETHLRNIRQVPPTKGYDC